MRIKELMAFAIAILFCQITVAQTWAQKLDYIRKNIKIYYLADPNVESPDIRSLDPAKIATNTNGIIFGATGNNGMTNCANLLQAIFSDKGDGWLQQKVYASLVTLKKPITVTIINDSATGIDSKYLSKYNIYVVGTRNSVWPATYSTSKTTQERGIAIGEYMSSPLGTFKETFAGLVTKLAAAEFGPAVIFGYPSGKYSYHIVSAIGNKFLTVKDANPDAGALLEIREFIGPALDKPAASQVWTLQSFKDRSNVFIKSRQGKVIDLKDGVTTNGATVQMWGMSGDANHRWELIPAGSGYFYIKNWRTGKVLDVSGGVDENGRKVWSYQRNNSASQKWKFADIEGPDNASLLTGEPTFCEKNFTSTDAEIDINTTAIGYCPQKQDEWESVTNQQLGISAKNRTRHYIGWSAADKPAAVVGGLAGRNWYPKSDFKKVHIGKLCEVGYFDAVGETTTGASWFVDREEKDFNLHVYPSSPYSYQIEKSVIGFDLDITIGGPLNIDCRDNWVKCGNTLVMEGEITPDDEWIKHPNNPYLGIKNNDGTSAYFLNQNIGMYGPWIVEEVHCNHPEIHPVEMLWSETSDPNVKYLCIFQDDSDRFGYYSNFPDYTDAETMYNRIPISKYKKELEAAKAKVNPWSPSPVSAQFYVAIQIDPSSTAKTEYTIDVQTSREVVTNNSFTTLIPNVESAGKTRVIKKSGVELFRVTENQLDEKDIGIRFELFKKKGSEIILGYMVISAAVSRDLDGKEGYMVLKLTKK